MRRGLLLKTGTEHMERTTPRVYCAGPLFNAKEQEEMQELARALEDAGFATFLPQRDGLELARCRELLVSRGYSCEHANRVLSEAIFALDVYQVLEGCDAVVVNLNGRVPDEGAVSEAAMAWARGKVVVGYKADMRTTFAGQDNPLVVGLFQFRLCSDLKMVVTVVSDGMRRRGLGQVAASRESEISSHLALGGALWAALQEGRDVERLIALVARHNGEVATVLG